eukprot:5934660-Amphidinium_carterae.1
MVHHGYHPQGLLHIRTCLIVKDVNVRSDYGQYCLLATFDMASAPTFSKAGSRRGLDACLCKI